MTTDTQREAHELIKPFKETLQHKVYRYINETGGATDEEIRNTLKMLYGSACARRLELVQQGKVRDGGKRKLSSSGRNVIIWEAA